MDRAIKSEHAPAKNIEMVKGYFLNMTLSTMSALYSNYFNEPKHDFRSRLVRCRNWLAVVLKRNLKARR